MSGRRAKMIRKECSRVGVGKSGYRRTKKAYKDGTLLVLQQWAKANGQA